ncbi:MAG TPA: helix-turn-helix domain-containing protein [Patescibacteria group bacterium]|nr:helix-turn-helix domain-containing protein [Patescibacteria group bacterium]
MPKLPTLSDETLELLGLKPKDMTVYTHLLKLGTAPLRRIAEVTNLNRGTTYDALKRLIDVGLVSHMDAKTHRYFTAEDPQKLTGLAMRREVAIQEAQLKLKDVVPQFQELLGMSAHRPSVRYYEGESGVRDILTDVLKTAASSKDKLFRIYSSEGIRDLIAHAWPGFIKLRVRKGVRVNTISIGEGGRTHGLDERKWLTQTNKAPSYIFIYPGKTAFVSLDERRQLFGVIIEDEAIAATQEMIFDALWKMM